MIPCLTRKIKLTNNPHVPDLKPSFNAVLHLAERKHYLKKYKLYLALGVLLCLTLNILSVRGCNVVARYSKIDLAKLDIQV